MKSTWLPTLLSPLLLSATVAAQQPVLLKPDRVFDGVSAQAHEGWVVLVRGEKIEQCGPADSVQAPKDVRVVELPDATLLPGLIDAHTHVLLHPYK